MRILGTDFKKIHLNRNSLKGNVELDKISYNMKVSDVAEREINLGTKTKVLAFECQFITEYPLKKPKSKKLGEIEILMDVVVHAPKEHKEILKNWKKKKGKLTPELAEFVLNVAFDQTMTEALSLSRKVLLPPPIRVPRLKLGEQKKSRKPK